MRIPVLLTSAAAILAACTTLAPVTLQIFEEPSPRVPHGAQSAAAVRWEGESVYYFSNHAPAAAGIMENPIAFPVYLSNLPSRLQISVDNAPAEMIAPDAAPTPDKWQYAYQLRARDGGNPNNANDLRNHLFLSPAQRPMLVDHGRTYVVAITDLGGSQQNAPPVTREYSFVYVARDRCQINSFTVDKTEVDPHESVTISLRASDSCKRVWIARSGGGAIAVSGNSNGSITVPSNLIYDDIRPGIGASANVSLSQAVQTQAVSFSARAFDAAGRSETRSVSVRVRTPPPTPPAPQCPMNPDGYPKTQNICVKCPGESYGRLIVGDYCDFTAAKTDLEGQFVGCTIKEGGC